VHLCFQREHDGRQACLFDCCSRCGGTGPRNVPSALTTVSLWREPSVVACDRASGLRHGDMVVLCEHKQ
jgi:hypothetical protein